MRHLLLTLLLLLLAGAAAFAEDAAEAEPTVDDTTAAEESTEQSEDAPLQSAEIPSQMEPQYTCFVSGKPWEPSPGRVEVLFSERMKLKRARFVNFAYFVQALASFEKQGRVLGVAKFSVVDFTTFGTPNEHMIEVDRDNTNTWFVFTEKRAHASAVAPYIFAFESRESADAFQQQHGGKVLEYSDLLTKIARQLNAANAEADTGFAGELMN